MARIGPEAAIKCIKMTTTDLVQSFRTRAESTTGEYLAHDIDFRKTLRMSTLDDKQVTRDSTNVTIDGIDVVSYTQPRDVRLSD